MAHKAIVAKIDKVEAIVNADRIQIGYVLGEPVVISKEWEVGDVGIFFPVDLQLSEEYCRENNLFRESSKNKDATQKGFFENTRRVRAQPFLGVRSCGLFMPLESIGYTGEYCTEVGTQFDELNGHKICEKYVSEKVRNIMKSFSSKKKIKVMQYPTFDKHIDTEQFLHNLHKIEKGSLIYITAKAHGSSFRTALKRETINLPFWKKFVNKIIIIFDERSDYQLVTGSRNVTIVEGHEGFHGSDKWRIDISKELEPYLEPGMQIFGEVLGYVNSKPIMSPHDVKALKDVRYIEKYGETVNFDYGCQEHEYTWFVYRITREDVNGNNIDMTQAELKSWCAKRNIKHSLQVCDPFVYDGNQEELVKCVITASEREDLLAECYLNPHAYGEGVVIRVENDKTSPDFYKYKNYAFKVGEGILEVDDMETLS